VLGFPTGLYPVGFEGRIHYKLGIGHYSQKNLLITRVLDQPGAPSGHLDVPFHHTKVLGDSEATACSSGRFAKERHMGC